MLHSPALGLLLIVLIVGGVYYSLLRIKYTHETSMWLAFFPCTHIGSVIIKPNGESLIVHGDKVFMGAKQLIEVVFYPTRELEHHVIWRHLGCGKELSDKEKTRIAKRITRDYLDQHYPELAKRRIRLKSVEFKGTPTGPIYDKEYLEYRYSRAIVYFVKK